MPTTANTINYYVAADGTLRDGQQGSIAQTPRINYGTEYSVTLSFPADTLQEGDQLQVALNRTCTFFSSASATGDAPVAAVAKHDVTAEEADAQAVTLTLSTNTRAMIDQVNGIDHPVRGFFGVHVLRGQSFVTLAVADALMMSLESGPDAISPPLPILDYPTRQEMNDAVEAAQNSASAAKTSEDNADASASAAARDAQAAGQSATNAGNSATLAESYAVGGTGTRPGEDTDNAKYYLEQLGDHEAQAKEAAQAAAGSATVAVGFARDAATAAGNAAGSATQAGQAATAATTAKNAAETAQGLAETAQGKAEQAQAKAEQAQGAAEAAQTASETAQGKAEDAQTAAETAQEKAEDAQDAAEDAQTSAEQARDEAISTLASKRDILQTLVTSSSTALVAEAGKSYNWTVSAASTIALATADKVANKETRIDIYIDLQDGGSVTGDGVAVADAVLQSGWYKLIWDGTNATLYSTKAGGAEAVITIPAATTSYNLQDNKHYQQVPSAVPTYTLPTASFDGLVHEITVLVDFMHVTSCSFVDASGVPVTLQSAISPSIGEAYIFRCYWYGKWRVVPLKIRNAATASSATGVVEVSDAVAGDALSLKMTAPRSVVMNQLMKNTIRFVSSSTGLTLSTTRNDDYSFSITWDNSNNIAVSASVGITETVSYRPSHRLLALSRIIESSGDSASILLYINRSEQNSFWNTSAIVNLNSTQAGTVIVFRIPANSSGSATFIIQMVDLTQYFNGDTTLIDSITSWDDLVAYDPRFAQYVQYNMGTVEGVTPSVKVTGKNLFNPQLFSDIDTTIRYKAIYVGNQPVTASSNVTSIGNRLYLIAGNVQEGESASSVFKNGTTRTVQPINGWITIAYRTYRSINPLDYNIQLELGDTATSYEPYHDGGTAASPVPLYGAGTAADSYDAVTGKVGHQVGYTRMYDRSSGTDYFAPSEQYPYGYAIMGFNSRAAGSNLLSTKYPMVDGFTTNKTIHAAGSGANIYVVDDALVGKTASEIREILADVMLYYELATPTTSQSTPTQISLQAGNNVAMQTDGGRTLAELSMTYENLPAES